VILRFKGCASSVLALVTVSASSMLMRIRNSGSYGCTGSAKASGSETGELIRVLNIFSGARALGRFIDFSHDKVPEVDQ
jgi:hypothetical protein